MAEPLVPGPSRLEDEITIAKLKKYKSGKTDSGRWRNVTVCDTQNH
jgi:hypothetical protein